MSDIVPTEDTPTTATPSTGITHLFGMVMQAVDRGAAVIYHDVLKAEATVTEWRTDNEALSGMLDEGIAYAKSLLNRAGVPVDTIEIVGEDVLASLKTLAAQDNSTSASTAPQPVPAPLPQTGGPIPATANGNAPNAAPVAAPANNGMQMPTPPPGVVVAQPTA